MPKPLWKCEKCGQLFENEEHANTCETTHFSVLRVLSWSWDPGVVDYRNDDMYIINQDKFPQSVNLELGCRDDIYQGKYDLRGAGPTYVECY